MNVKELGTFYSVEDGRKPKIIQVLRGRSTFLTQCRSATSNKYSVSSDASLHSNNIPFLITSGNFCKWCISKITTVGLGNMRSEEGVVVVYCCCFPFCC